jgi:hypothetical protein
LDSDELRRGIEDRTVVVKKTKVSQVGG